MKKLIYPAALILLFIILTATILPADAVYGSNTDWLSQHAALAETIRDACVEQHTLLPDWIGLGSGSSGYQFSYYGFLRPDILIGCLFPQVPMVYILTSYMFALYIAAVLLCYIWLQSEELSPFFSFLGSVLFLTAGCLFHMHRQIMFVNYLPFLILAFLCVKKRKFRFLPLCMLLICLHSFYFAISAFAAIGWYWLRTEKETFWKDSFFKKYIPSALISVCMAAALLLPTGLVLMEHRRSGGGFFLLKILELFGPNISMNNILFNEYGLGLTLVCFYTILAGLNKKNPAQKEFFPDSVLFLSFGLFGIFSYILNGTLYARPKILIPFLPLFILHCVRYLRSAHEETYSKKHTEKPVEMYPLYPFAIMLPISLLWFSQVQFPWILIELGILFLFCLIRRRGRRTGTPPLSGERSARFLIWKETFVYLLVLIAPIGMYITTAKKENWVKKEDVSANTAPANLSELSDRSEYPALSESSEFPALSESSEFPALSESSELSMNPLYHFDSLTEPLANGNLLPAPEMTRSSMYSSVTNSAYSDLYYDTLMTPIRINNRVALLTSDNPFMLHLLGIRYIETDEKHIPSGYTPLYRTSKGTVIAENENVIPNVYFTSDTISEEEFDRFSKTEQLEAISAKTVVGSSTGNPEDYSERSSTGNPEEYSERSSAGSAADSAYEPGKFLVPFTPKLSIDGNLPDSLNIKKTADGYDITSKCKQSLTFYVENAEFCNILLLSFRVDNKTIDPVVIDINDIRNKLSGLFAPYPNGNDTFHYQFSTDSDSGMTKLTVTFPKGHFTVSNIQWHLCSEKIFDEKNSVTKAVCYSSVGRSDFLSGTTIFSGSVEAESEGIIASAIPLQNGLELYIDGKRAEIVRVNKAFAGTFIEKGTHRIEFRFSPPGKQLGCMISLISLLCYFCYLIFTIFAIFKFRDFTSEKTQNTTAARHKSAL